MLSQIHHFVKDTTDHLSLVIMYKIKSYLKQDIKILFEKKSVSRKKPKQTTVASLFVV